MTPACKIENSVARYGPNRACPNQAKPLAPGQEEAGLLRQVQDWAHSCQVHPFRQPLPARWHSRTRSLHIHSYYTYRSPGTSHRNIHRDGGDVVLRNDGVPMPSVQERSSLTRPPSLAPPRTSLIVCAFQFLQKQGNQSTVKPQNKKSPVPVEAQGLHS